MSTLINVSGVSRCTILERINRFTVEITHDGGKTRAYLCNTGRLSDYLKRGREGFCTTQAGGKLPLRLFAVLDVGGAAIVDTQLQMKAFEQAAMLRLIPWLSGWEIAKRNVRLLGSTIDYLFKADGSSLFLEVKSAVLRGDGYALYPDCPSPRGQRHIEALTRHAEAGGMAGVSFIAAIPEALGFKPYREGDPRIAELLKKAAASGVAIRALSMHFDPEESAVCLDSPSLPVEI
jgi:sugar fermentation stimulation protein A